MRIPRFGEHDPEAAVHPAGMTIEHDLQKRRGSGLDIHLRLAHKVCNR